jgi:hypothetical protein
MKLIVLTFILLQQSAFACWKVEALMSVNEDKVEINQKLDHDKTYSFPAGSHIFHLKMPSQGKEITAVHSVEFGVQKKTGITLSKINEHKINIESGKKAVFTNNDTNGELTTFMMKITEI